MTRPAGPLTDDERRHLIDVRHDLHRRPELAFREEETARRLEEELRSLDSVTVRRVADTGLVARIPGRGTGPVVAIRGDTDGLPIQEETGVSWASERDGIMHACGHDVHATWTIGAARLLARNPPEGDVLVVLQPAEETAEGARAVLASGAIDEARAIFGGHVDLRFPVGRIVVQPGPLAASTDTFAVELRGRGGHSGRPQEAVDPIAAAADVIRALYVRLPRRFPPGRATVATVGMVEAGSAPNVIPDTATLRGTLRASDAGLHRELLEAFRAIIRETTGDSAVEAVVDVDAGVPPLVNDERATRWARRAVEEVLGAGAPASLPHPNMAGEDFAFYLQRMQGCFLRIGAGTGEPEPPPAHSPGFLPADDSVPVGAAVLARAARIASSALAAEA